ncbi:hypothetical protein [Metabacillus fastidiosus]|uniref:hypothetical protein n=1 Tax=Metabacillus fastidiosus TaxID=1458 RepID=UPI002DB6FF8D|nr:hypothetical protein [Metabacillus fastidiosus]MEC2075363.1 hypothetical protein [Metabacillus fastidiosus]
MKRTVSSIVIAGLLLTPIHFLSTEQPVSAQTVSSYDAAVKQGEKVKAITSSLNTSINQGIIKKVNIDYDLLVPEVKKLEQSIGKVSGSTNRKKLEATYLVPAKVAIERVIYEVSQYRLMLLLLDWRYGIGPDAAEYENMMLKLERLKERAAHIKQTGGYKELPPAIDAELRKIEAEIQGFIVDFRVDEYNRAMNAGNLAQMNEIYDHLTKQVKLAQQRIGKVSGSKNRQKLNDEHVVPAKVIIERSIYEISQYRLLNVISNHVAKGDIESAKQGLATLERLKERAVKIKEAGGYAPLPQSIQQKLKEKEASVLAQIKDSEVISIN